MQAHYNLTSIDIWQMSWRRFCVMFYSIFNWTGETDTEGSLPEQYAEGGNRRSHYEQAVHEAQGADSALSRSFDWDAALGRDAPDTKNILTTEEVLSGGHTGGARVET